MEMHSYDILHRKVNMDQNIKVRCSRQLIPTLTLYLLGCLIHALTLPTTEPPLMDGHPFVVIWNAPTNVCKQLEIPLDTSVFHAVTTPAAVPGQFLTLFYVDRLGLYPHVDPVTKQEYNGGIPQKGNLTANLMKASNDIAHFMPSDSIPGLAVIDWEDWRPMWERNWGSKDIYRQLSISYSKEKDPTLPQNQVTPTAKRQFKTAARNYMQETMMLGRNIRPSQLWGFYLFPDCYNYGWEMPGYTGTCPVNTQKLNDQLLWLWESSTALYPSIYLPLSLSDSPNAAYFVRNRIQEAVRVAALTQRPYTVPIYVYSRPLYRDQNKLFLSQEDLVRSVGESAALGASGTVMWGASADYNGKAECEALSAYLTSTLNPYIANVTAAAKLCSDVLCQGNGRCVRKNYNSTDYLHLNPENFHILKLEEKYMAVGLPSSADLNVLADKFTCQCYTGHTCSDRLSYPRKPIAIQV
ncbi:hyaluronidase PH-20-like [Osmerus mordax]|uniref:hyaluronidase PH-20-like n=1 Tax=Osmerus mordax TaxID=8014 RepID=UPI0035102B23